MAGTAIVVQLFPTTQVLKETFANKGAKVATPTSNNPFMNVLFTDYVDNPNRPSAPPDVTAPAVKESIEEAFAQTSEMCIRDSDKFTLAQSARQWATQASTTIPNDFQSFQDFLNKGNISRKEVSEGYVVAKGSTFNPA